MDKLLASLGSWRGHGSYYTKGRQFICTWVGTHRKPWESRVSSWDRQLWIVFAHWKTMPTTPVSPRGGEGAPLIRRCTAAAMWNNLTEISFGHRASGVYCFLSPWYESWKQNISRIVGINLVAYVKLWTQGTCSDQTHWAWNTVVFPK